MKKDHKKDRKSLDKKKRSSKDKSMKRTSEKSVSNKPALMVSHDKEPSRAPLNNPHHKTRLLLILAIIFILGIFITTLFYFDYYLIDFKEVNTSVIITSTGGGFNTNTWELNFGKAAPGAGGTKHFTVYSNVKARVAIKVIGKMNDFLSVSENNFIINPQERRQIDVDLNVPADTPLGLYQGKLQVFMYKTT